MLCNRPLKNATKLLCVKMTVGIHKLLRKNADLLEAGIHGWNYLLLKLTRLIIIACRRGDHRVRRIWSVEGIELCPLGYLWTCGRLRYVHRGIGRLLRNSQRKQLLSHQCTFAHLLIICYLSLRAGVGHFQIIIVELLSNELAII